ncbi:hypothetical protein QBC46DRAFT_386043 [Diplogelasinospora grovesii]|uniref:Postreplication repair E3 ubiquitin-protein ligase RAD18 n=1 Tax=Diplogelasinospora grovesii TaxID=303347 RepID=A0AAN6N6P8_9PEZI|nr:hypothetical protein QBC46DRAFT_386043 [Diplogelasinospora grovesii]
MDGFGDGTFDVPDSTDWLGTPLASLMPVEQAFRCHVCKDFYNSPMLTSCNHTFCSICIRRCLSVDGKCPLCRALDQESKLRGNWALREAVDAFVKSRDSMLRFARTAAAATTTTAAPSSPKRKAAEIQEAEEEQRENKRPRMSTRSSKARAAEANAAIMREEVGVPEVEDPMDLEEPDDGLVGCPICWTRMKPFQVDRHIDTSCPGSPQPRPPPQQASASASANSRSTTTNGFPSRPAAFQASSPSRAKAPERLPALAYSMLKDNALRKKLSELGLSTSGSRQLLERRHQEWITLWNANCDSARPKKRSELLHDLDVWERTMGSRAPTMSRSANVGAQIKDKDFDGAAWAARHDTSFKDLIANARRTRSQAEKKAQEAASDSEQSSKEPDSKDEITTSDEQQQQGARLSSVVDVTRPASSPPHAEEIAGRMDGADERTPSGYANEPELSLSLPPKAGMPLVVDHGPNRAESAAS